MLPFDRYYVAIQQGAADAADVVADTDPGAPVPTCPEWTFADLVRHLGTAHRWAATTVERRATEAVPFDTLEDTEPGDDAATWLRDGARRLAEALHAAGPETRVWSFTPDQTAGFWARRMAHETTIHAADALIAAGRNVSLPADLAADGVSEWLAMVSVAAARGHTPAFAELRGTGETLHFHTTDGWLGRSGEWLVRRTPEGLEVDQGHAKADVAVRADAGDLALLLSRRIPADAPGVQILGDRALFEHWLAHTAF
jgi:uncharacterized protein (TIGR03083 family)